MKSTMGEVELHVMAQRLQAAKRAAAGRGELRTPLPVGYVHDEAGAVDRPGRRGAAAISDLFAAFAACGSAYGVVAAFAGRRFRCAPTAGCGPGNCAGAADARPVLGVLKNPCYAGAYVHGRYTSTRRSTRTARAHRAVARPEWPVLIRDHHEGYIGWAPTWPTRRDWPATAPTPAPDRRNRVVPGHHRLRLVRQTDAHQLPQRSAPGL